HRGVVRNNGESAVADHVLQHVRHIRHSTLRTPESELDIHAIPIAIVSACELVATTVIISIIPVAAVGMIIANRNAGEEHIRRHEPAFGIIEFLILASAIPGVDSQHLICAWCRVASHHLIVHGNPAIDAAARNQILHDARHVFALRSESIIGAHDEPRSCLSRCSRGEHCGCNGKRCRGDKNLHKTAKGIHSRLLRCGLSGSINFSWLMAAGDAFSVPPLTKMYNLYKMTFRPDRSYR